MGNCLPPSTIWKNKPLEKDNTKHVANFTSLGHKNNKQDRQYMWCVCVTTVAVEKQQLLNNKHVCLYSCLSYPACRSHLFCTVL